MFHGRCLQNVMYKSSCMHVKPSIWARLSGLQIRCFMMHYEGTTQSGSQIVGSPDQVLYNALWSSHPIWIPIWDPDQGLCWLYPPDWGPDCKIFYNLGPDCKFFVFVLRVILHGVMTGYSYLFWLILTLCQLPFSLRIHNINPATSLWVLCE